MSKTLLAVFGATGNQGGSIIRYVLADQALSQRYAIRAITRNTTSPDAQSLASKGVEVVAADLDNPSTLPAALKGASFIFATTNTQYSGNTRAVETRQAKAICDEALKQGAQYLIWSSMSHPYKISGGKLTHVEHFDVKAEIETYMRGLPIRAAFFAPAGFMQNFVTNQMPRPSPANDGTYVLANILHPHTINPQIDITETGAFIAPILADPDAFEGKFLAAAQGFYTPVEIAETMSKVSGKTVRHVQLEDEVYKGYLPEPMREQLYEMNVLIRDYGYYGEGMKGLVEETGKIVNGKLSGFEEFLRRIEFKLE
jgi:uncharacterized protein YbjT (DUF2867 family)